MLYKYKTFTIASLALLMVNCKTRPYNSTTLNNKNTDTCPSDDAFVRDWATTPAIETLQNNALNLYVLGDIHGRFDEFFELLLRAKIISAPKKDVKNFEWIAQNSVLVQVGDLINKGDYSVEVVNFSINLQQKAAAAGGKAIFLLGNHEADFLGDPYSSKHNDFRKQLAQNNMDVCSKAYSSASTIGAWFRNHPIAAVINKLYISHTGWVGNLTLPELETKYKELKYTGKFMCGKGSEPGKINARVWWNKSEKTFGEVIDRLNISTILFGHMPSAFNYKGEILGYFDNVNGRKHTGLIKLDDGLGELTSRGGIFRCNTWSDKGNCTKPERLYNPKHEGNSIPPGDALFEEFNIKEGAPPDNVNSKETYGDGC